MLWKLVLIKWSLKWNNCPKESLNNKRVKTILLNKSFAIGLCFRSPIYFVEYGLERDRQYPNTRNNNLITSRMHSCVHWIKWGNGNELIIIHGFTPPVSEYFPFLFCAHIRQNHFFLNNYRHNCDVIAKQIKRQ